MLNPFKKLFKKGTEPTPESTPPSTPASAAVGNAQQPTSEPMTMTSMLDAQIALLGGPIDELDSESWGDVADRLVSAASDMPAPPAFPMVATRVISMARDPALDINKLSGEIQRDAGIATTLLRVANSAAFSPPSPVTTVRAAIQMLGMQQVIQIVVGGSGKALYEVTSSADLALFPALWPTMFKESMGNSFVAGRIALDVRGASSENALLAGLLVDVGRPLALRVLSKLIRGGMARPQDAIIVAALEEVAPEFGTRAIGAMGLPEQLVAACRPDPNSTSVDAAIAQLVGALGAVQRRSSRMWVSAGELRRQAETLGLSPLVVRSMFAQRTSFVEQAAAMFGN